MPSNIYPKKKKKSDPHAIHFSKTFFHDSLGNLNTLSLKDTLFGCQTALREKKVLLEIA